MSVSGDAWALTKLYPSASDPNEAQTAEILSKLAPRALHARTPGSFCTVCSINGQGPVAKPIRNIAQVPETMPAAD
jgi:hypothetical protein